MRAQVPQPQDALPVRDDGNVGLSVGQGTR